MDLPEDVDLYQQPKFQVICTNVGKLLKVSFKKKKEVSLSFSSPRTEYISTAIKNTEVLAHTMSNDKQQ
jgi:hypothetical protein